uniref:Nucleoporin Nup54 alpha-helical domain-containing protein n=1 Tax=Cyclophora tenuis TaxID=216820 RepID=A0A7S1D274_CYCTE|mmetsp:Transcript_16049/g.27175  ORF Transcript_16049/g.27175 Transcript_16049/m.27175 type:complete len:252 (+) Transcript_16049:336-1091(+)
MDASARQEAAKLQSSMEAIHQSYSGTNNSEKESSPFVTIVYNNMTPEQLQWQFTHQQSGGGLAAPPRPPQVSEKDWLDAIVKNPNPQAYIPSALVGAEALQARLGWQQERANDLEKAANSLKSVREDLQKRVEQYQQALQDLHRRHDDIRKRMLAIMMKVEIARCMNMPLQKDEILLAQRLVKIMKDLEKANKTLESIPTSASISSENVTIPNSDQLAEVLNLHRQEILQLTSTMQGDMRDVQALHSKRLS